MAFMFTKRQLDGWRGYWDFSTSGNGCFLHTGDEAEAQILADFTDLAQKAQVENKFLVFTRAQVLEQLIHDQEQTVVWVLRVKRRHHLLEGTLIIRNRASIGEGKADTQCV